MPSTTAVKYNMEIENHHMYVHFFLSTFVCCAIKIIWLEQNVTWHRNTEYRKLVNTEYRKLGNLKFDLMLFTELKMNTKFPWTVPLSDILKLHVPGSNDKKAKYILYQHVCSSIKPNIAQDEADSIAFYQVYNKKNRDKFKIPKFLEHIVDSNKTPVVTLRTGYKAFQVGMQGRQFTSYWEIFVKTHELELGDTLVFIPESINSFTVQIYKPNGVEKLLSWYHKYYVYSYL
ncbi:unnamed protein product [Coffea canephora]|uniref:DH200=94 genomic scaffold, scaffold_1402 n=1 Tax=Coffea canephora TaxID=49390 RepID=A0A068VLN4_COFCA|nr:unnamed protein product [Coffea canephora]